MWLSLTINDDRDLPGESHLGLAVPNDQPLSSEQIASSIADYLRDAELDSQGFYFARLDKLRRTATESPTYSVCSDALRQIEPLHTELIRIHDRTATLLAGVQPDRSPDQGMINICALLITYLALLVVLLPITPRSAIRTTPWILAGVWTIATFVAAFSEGWGPLDFIELTLALWFGSACLAAHACRARSNWRLAAAAALATMLLTPIVPVLASQELFEWEFRSLRVIGGVFDIVDALLTDPDSAYYERHYVIRVGSWCLVWGWLLTALLLVPYQWLAARATSLPANQPD